jgi:hypothetical protein
MLLSVLALATGLAASAAAHDFWIEPGSFRPQVGAKVPLRLHVGQDFKGDTALFNAEQFERYVVGGPGGQGDERPVSGSLGDDPAGTVTIAQPGLYAVMYHSKKFEVTFDDFKKFEDYMKEEGLERQMPLAKARAGNGGKIREQYMRCAKTLIAAPQGEAGADRNFGCTLELVAESNPYRDSELRVQLLYKNAPVEGVLVVAFNKADPANRLKARSGKDGRVSFKLPASGVWLVKAVHMVPQARFIRGDWDSFWASLTFERP